MINHSHYIPLWRAEKRVKRRTIPSRNDNNDQHKDEHGVSNHNQTSASAPPRGGWGRGSRGGQCPTTAAIRILILIITTATPPPTKNDSVISQPCGRWGRGRRCGRCGTITTTLIPILIMTTATPTILQHLIALRRVGTRPKRRMMRKARRMRTTPALRPGTASDTMDTPTMTASICTARRAQISAQGMEIMSLVCAYMCITSCGAAARRSAT